MEGILEKLAVSVDGPADVLDLYEDAGPSAQAQESEVDPAFTGRELGTI